MKVRALLLSAVIVLSFNLPAATGASSDSIHDSEWGLPVNGLQMSISEDEPTNDGNPRFQVQFRNIGKQDFMLNLGRVLGNGRTQIPDRISLELPDPSGKTQRLKFFNNIFVAGRVDDYVIPLKTDSTYSITVDLDQFYSPDSKGFNLRLTSGRTKVVGSLDGLVAMNINSDTPGIALMEFWTGKVWSNTLVVQK